MKALFRSFGYTLFVLAAWCLAPFSSKLRRALSGRRGLARRTREWRAKHGTAPLWFHVSSSGEFEQCLPILDGLRERFPKLPIFVTVFSPSGHRALSLESERRRAAGKPVPWDGADYSPYDFRLTARAFIEALRPACFIAIHREMWPGLLHECHARKIPTFLFAAYFPPRAYRTFSFYRELAPLFSFIGTVEPESASFLQRELPTVSIAPVGDPRIERVLLRRHLRRPAAWASALEGRPVFIGASLWEADFRALRPALESVLTEFPEWRLVLVPHEPDSPLVAQLTEWLERQGRPVQRWSQWLNAPEGESHLVVDKVGFLAELYAAADLVFVGGSFRARVHNVLEPAAYAAPILTGPYIYNSREAQEMAAEKSALFTAKDPAEFATRLLELVRDEGQRAKASEAALAYLEKRQGATAMYIDRLAESLHLT